MATLVNLRDLLQHEVEDLYSAEEQIIDALPKLVEKASDRELKLALNEHLWVTREQKTRLDRVKKLLTGEESEARKGFLGRLFGSGTKCKGTEGLIKEGEKLMAEDMDPKVRDAAIIAACQKIEHYEISGYGTARAYAAELGLTEVARLLEITLQEEYKADDALTSLATRKVNLEAGGGSEGPRGLSQGGRIGNGLRASVKIPAKKAAPKKGSAKKGASKKTAKERTVKGAAKSGRKKAR